LDSTYTGKLDVLVNYITQTKGLYALIDVHNYARYSGTVLAASGTPSYAQFGTLWQVLATRYKSNAKAIFGLMNEPHDMATEVWRDAAQTAINSIRAAGATNLITVSGNGYDGASTWVNGAYYGNSNANVLKALTDSGKNFVFEVHQYLDSDSSGTHAACSSVTAGRDRLKDFYAWCKANNYKALLGEFGGQDPSTCQAAVTDIFNYLTASSDVFIGWTWWTAGTAYDYFGNYNQLFLIQNIASAKSTSPATIRSWIQPFLSASSTWSPAEVSTPDNNAWIYSIVGVVGILVLIAIVIITLRIRLRRKRANSYARESIAQEKSPEQATPIALATASSVTELDVDSPIQLTLSTETPATVTATNSPSTDSEWKLQSDSNGKEYYYNNTTGVSQWENPETTV